MGSCPVPTTSEIIRLDVSSEIEINNAVRRIRAFRVKKPNSEAMLFINVINHRFDIFERIHHVAFLLDHSRSVSCMHQLDDLVAYFDLNGLFPGKQLRASRLMIVRPDTYLNWDAAPRDFDALVLVLKSNYEGGSPFLARALEFNTIRIRVPEIVNGADESLTAYYVPKGLKYCFSPIRSGHLVYLVFEIFDYCPPRLEARNSPIEISGDFFTTFLNWCPDKDVVSWCDDLYIVKRIHYLSKNIRVYRYYKSVQDSYHSKADMSPVMENTLVHPMALMTKHRDSDGFYKRAFDKLSLRITAMIQQTPQDRLCGRKYNLSRNEEQIFYYYPGYIMVSKKHPINKVIFNYIGSAKSLESGGTNTMTRYYSPNQHKTYPPPTIHCTMIRDPVDFDTYVFEEDRRENIRAACAKQFFMLIDNFLTI